MPGNQRFKEIDNQTLGLAHALMQAKTPSFRKEKAMMDNIMMNAGGNAKRQRGNIGYRFNDGSSIGIGGTNSARNGLAMNEVKARKMLSANNALEAFHKPSTGPYQEKMSGLRISHKF